MKWKIGFVAYCCLILWLSSLAPKELPDQIMTVPDYVLHLVEYCFGILAWAAFGSGGGFPWGLFAFVPVLELPMSAGRIGGHALTGGMGFCDGRNRFIYWPAYSMVFWKR